MRHLLMSILACGLLSATAYQVGPDKTYTSLDDVRNLLNPGDVVEVDGNATYAAGTYLSRSGTGENPIIIRGIIPSGGSRPLLTGSGTYGINIAADHVVFENFEVADMQKGIGVFADSITVRGCVIHGCNHGLVGYGTGTGSVTVEYCEFYGNGVSTGGATQHQIYMATDEQAHPGAVFRLQFCYLHDGVEGDNVKSRAERNEIYYNWVERAGSVGHGLGLFAPDPEDNAAVTVSTAREDADVVGNVIIQHQNACARIGGDAPGYPTNGRYRFVNNTFILTGTRGDVIRTFNTVETLEMYNNVVYATGSAIDLRVLNDADGTWVHDPRSVIGSHNWIMDGATRIPSEWTNTLGGNGWPFGGTQLDDYTLHSGSQLISAGTDVTPAHPQYPALHPLFPPAYHPPYQTLIKSGEETIRPASLATDIGAYGLWEQSIRPGRNTWIPGPDYYEQVFDITGKNAGTRSGMRIISRTDGTVTMLRKEIFLK